MDKGKRALHWDQLNKFAKTWIYFVCSRLFPISHFTCLEEGVHVLYCVVRGESINVGQLIYN